MGGAAGVLGAALVGIGFPRDTVVKYELEVKAGRYLVVARGQPDVGAKQALEHLLHPDDALVQVEDARIEHPLPAEREELSGEAGRNCRRRR